MHTHHQVRGREIGARAEVSRMAYRSDPPSLPPLSFIHVGIGLRFPSAFSRPPTPVTDLRRIVRGSFLAPRSVGYPDLHPAAPGACWLATLSGRSGGRGLHLRCRTPATLREALVLCRDGDIDSKSKTGRLYTSQRKVRSTNTKYKLLSLSLL